MTKANTQVIAKIVAVLAVVAFGLSMFALSAQAQSSSASACASFNRDLTVGATGADVTALQTWLIGKGFAIPAGATGYFGGQTQAAVAKYQASVGITPAAGYFGPITRAQVASVTCAGGGTDDDDDDDTDDDTDDDDNGDLEGGAGSIEDADFMSGLNNEEVGEDEEDVEVAGLEIEVDDGSDIELTAVRLDFGQGTATNDDFDEFATDVSLWLDGEELARVDAEDFNEDNNWAKTISLDEGGIIRAGEMGDLTVAVSGASNLDSDDEGDTWNVEFENIRFEDADGATITDNDTGDINGVTRTFSFEAFASAADVELNIQEDDEEINDAHVINVDDADDTDDEPLLSFTMEAEGDSSIELNDLPVNFDVTGASHVDDLISSVYLFADGEEIGSENVGTDVGTDETITFDDLEYTIDAGDTVEFEVRADFNSTGDDLDEGDTISAQISATERALIDAEDESGEELAAGDMTGTAVGEAHAVYDVGIMVDFVSATESMSTGVDGAADDDTVTLAMTFDVEAFDGTVYVSNNATPTTAADGAVTAIDVDDGGLLYRYEIDGVATVALLSDTVSHTNLEGTVTTQLASGADGGEFTFQEGEKARITVTITRVNAATHVDSDGFHQAFMVAIGWSATNEDDTMEVYEFNLEDFETDPIFAN